jgi:hypothetical protein
VSSGRFLDTSMYFRPMSRAVDAIALRAPPDTALVAVGKALGGAVWVVA